MLASCPGYGYSKFIVYCLLFIVLCLSLSLSLSLSSPLIFLFIAAFSFEKSIMLELDARMREAKVPEEEQALKEWDDAFEHLTEDDLTYANKTKNKKNKKQKKNKTNNKTKQ